VPRVKRCSVRPTVKGRIDLHGRKAGNVKPEASVDRRGWRVENTFPMIVAPSRSPNVQGHTPPDSLYHSTAGKGLGPARRFQPQSWLASLTSNVFLVCIAFRIHCRRFIKDGRQIPDAETREESARSKARKRRAAFFGRVFPSDFARPSLRPISPPREKTFWRSENLQRSCGGADDNPEAARCVIPAALRGAPYGNLR